MLLRFKLVLFLLKKEGVITQIASQPNDRFFVMLCSSCKKTQQNTVVAIFWSFQEIGKAFITEQSVEYNGTDHVFNGDTFNEMQPKSSSTTYLASVSKAVYEAMAEVDDRAVWLMQGWLFLNDREFWQPDQIKAYLRGKIRSCNIFYPSNLFVCKSVLRYTKVQ